MPQKAPGNEPRTIRSLEDITPEARHALRQIVDFAISQETRIRDLSSLPTSSVISQEMRDEICAALRWLAGDEPQSGGEQQADAAEQPTDSPEGALGDYQIGANGGTLRLTRRGLKCVLQAKLGG